MPALSVSSRRETRTDTASPRSPAEAYPPLFSRRRPAPLIRHCWLLLGGSATGSRCFWSFAGFASAVVGRRQLAAAIDRVTGEVARPWRRRGQLVRADDSW